MTALGEVLSDYGNAGLTLRNHPMSFLRPWLDDNDVQVAARLRR